MKFQRWLIAACLWILVVAAQAGSALAQQGSGSPSIRIDGPWVRESPIGASSGGGYMVIINSGSQGDRLISAQSSAARTIELKQVVYVDEAQKTRDVPNGIEIPPNSHVRLRWESYFLLFVDLKQPFAPFRPFEASLNFEKSGPITVQFDVRPRMP